MVTRLSVAFLMVLSVARGGARSETFTLPEDPVSGAEVVRVGRIIIEGNTSTPDWIIIQKLSLYPGQVVSPCDLTLAEMNLARVNLFQMRPVITILEPEKGAEFKDILITVTERPNPHQGCGFYWLFRIEELVRGTCLEEPLRNAEEKRAPKPLINTAFTIFESHMDGVGVTLTARRQAFP